MCPEVVVLARDPDLEARRFEPVVAAVESLCPGVELSMPGECYLATRGPSRYLGGDRCLAERVSTVASEAVARLIGSSPPTSADLEAAGALCKVGVADGPFAARLAAASSLVVPPGESASFLSGFSVSVLGTPELGDILRRMGIRTLGQLAGLPESALTDRFGPEGAKAHRLARGEDGRSLATRVPPPDLSVSKELDPPVERVDAVAFVARSLAQDLHAQLAESGLGCTGVLVQTETEHGERISRLWSHDGPLGASAIAERVRWQLDAWLTCRVGDRRLSPTTERPPTAGITKIRLVPTEAEPSSGVQGGFWGGSARMDERGSRAFARVQGMLGHESVVTAELCGGRGPGERARLVAWGDSRSELPLHEREAPPWPGRIPRPSPVLVHRQPPQARLVGRDGEPVRVSGRGAVSAAPARLSVDGGPWSEVVGWAGPWPADERWWDPEAHRRRARMQVLLGGGRAHLLALEAGCWTIEATYD